MIMKKYGLLWVMFFLLIAATAAYAQDAPPIPGQIAVVGTDYNLYTLNPESGQQTALTTDAAVSNTSVHIYEDPVWSTGGELAFFGTLADTNGVSTNVMISPDGTAPAVSAVTLPDVAITYASWAPFPCGDSCRDLALLLSNNASTFTVDLVRTQGDQHTVTETETGAPFYFSWSPDGSQMLWQRNDTRLDIFDTQQAQISETLPQSPGAMFAPAWSPVDDRLLFTVPNGSASNLVVSSNGDLQTLVSNQTNPVQFSWSSDGSQIAYIDRSGPLVVIDAASGDVVTRTTDSGVIAFFWSPDGSHIAYLTLGVQPTGSFSASAPSAIKIGAPMMQQNATAVSWSVLDIASGSARHYGLFVPTREETYIISFFDQFAQSHRVWSPDSRYLVYAELTSDRRAVVSLLDTTQDVAVPSVLTDGVVGIWSFD